MKIENKLVQQYTVHNRGGIEDTTFEAKDSKKCEAKTKDRLFEERPS